MKYIQINKWYVTIQDTKDMKHRTYRHASEATKTRLEKLVSHLPKTQNGVYTLSYHPLVMYALYMMETIHERTLETITKGDMIIIDNLAFEVVKANPKHIKLRRAGVSKWPVPEKQELRFTSYPRHTLLTDGHPVSRAEAAVLFKAQRLIDKKEG